MLRPIRPLSAIAVLACSVGSTAARANPPGVCASEPTANQPYRVVVHSPPPSVVVLEGDGERKCLKLFSLCHKDKKPPRESAPGAMWVPVPVMVPAVAPTCAAPPPPPGGSCLTPPPGGGSRMQNFYMGSDYASITAAGEDLRATIAKLKSMRAEREAELAAIDTALSPITGLAPRANPRTVSAPILAAPAAANSPSRQDLKDLNDKLDYLTALVDALADDIRKTEPKSQLPAFDELNGLRKTKP